MIIQGNSEYIVMNKSTKEVISRHPFDSDYTKKKAKEEALASNTQWKESHE